MSQGRVIVGILVGTVILGCAAMPDRAGASSAGTIQSIEHIDRSTAAVAGVLATGAISGGPVSGAAPTGAGAAGDKSGTVFAGAVASAAAPAGDAPRSEVPGYRVNIRLDRGSMRSDSLKHSRARASMPLAA